MTKTLLLLLLTPLGPLAVSRLLAPMMIPLVVVAVIVAVAAAPITDVPKLLLILLPPLNRLLVLSSGSLSPALVVFLLEIEWRKLLTKKATPSPPMWWFAHLQGARSTLIAAVLCHFKVMFPRSGVPATPCPMEMDTHLTLRLNTATR